MSQTAVIRFDTRAFVRSHGQEPRGSGSWLFGIDFSNPDILDPAQTIIVQGPHTYTEAKRLARATATSSGLRYVTLYVLP